MSGLKWLQAALDRNRAGMEDCQVFMQLWDEKLLNDPIPVMQTGLAVLLNKPFVFVVPPGTLLPENLRRLARQVIECDLTDPSSRESLAARVREAMEEVAR